MAVFRNGVMPWLPQSAEKIHFRKVDKLSSPAIENGLRHEDAKMIRLLQCRPGRHGKLLSCAQHVDENRPLVCKRRLDGASQLLWLVNPDAANTHGFRHHRKVGVLEITARV